jgi:hypothetical protein
MSFSFSHIFNNIIQTKITMDYSKKINQIRTILGLQAKFASAKLADGTVVESDGELAAGSALSIVAEDGSKSPAPAGEHKLEDGSTVLVDEKGTIVSIEEAPVEKLEEIVPEEKTDAVKMAEDPIDGSEPAAPAEGAIDEKIVESLKKMIMEAVEPIIEEIAMMKTKMGQMEESYNKFAKAPAAGKIPTITNDHSKQGFAQHTDLVERYNELKNSLK